MGWVFVRPRREIFYPCVWHMMPPPVTLLFSVLFPSLSPCPPSDVEGASCEATDPAAATILV